MGKANADCAVWVLFREFDTRRIRLPRDGVVDGMAVASSAGMAKDSLKMSGLGEIFYIDSLLFSTLMTLPGGKVHGYSQYVIVSIV